MSFRARPARSGSRRDVIGDLLWLPRVAPASVVHAAILRTGGAMNSGPTGARMVSDKMRSISALAGSSAPTDHLVDRLNLAGMPRAPERYADAWSSIQRTASELALAFVRTLPAPGEKIELLLAAHEGG